MIKVHSKWGFNFVKNAKKIGLISLVLIITSVTIILKHGLQYGVDFSGGIMVNFTVNNLSNDDDGKSLRATNGLRKFIADKMEGNEFSLQHVISSNSFILKISSISGSVHESSTKIKNILTKDIKIADRIEIRKIDAIGPSVTKEFFKNSMLAITFAFCSIFFYISIRFGVSFGLFGIIALLHDIILTVGFISISNIELTLTTVAGILTIIGYSINDTVVIYDRIKLNLQRYPDAEISDVINVSNFQVLRRSIITSLVTLIAVSSMVFIPDMGLSDFCKIIMFGIIIGTYSSIFIPPSLLILFKTKRRREGKINNDPMRYI